MKLTIYTTESQKKAKAFIKEITELYPNVEYQVVKKDRGNIWVNATTEDEVFMDLVVMRGRHYQIQEVTERLNKITSDTP